MLAGLRLTREQVVTLFQGVWAMRESTAYQFILDEGRAEGRAEEARRILLRLGRKQLGAADEATEAALQAVSDLDRLERLSERLLEVSTWQELLATP